MSVFPIGATSDVSFMMSLAHAFIKVNLSFVTSFYRRMSYTVKQCGAMIDQR